MAETLRDHYTPGNRLGYMSPGRDARALLVRQTDGTLTSSDEIVRKWRERIEQAREHRKRLEPIWLSNLAFAAGQHWLAWDPYQKQLRHISDLDPRYANRELYTADRVNEHVQAQLGELSTDDDRPELLLAQEGDTAEEQQKEVNSAVAHAWEYEWGADSALVQVRRLCLKLGTAAIRCRFDPSKGPLTGHQMVGPDGQPVQDPGALDHVEATGQLPDGSLPQFQPVNEGRTVLEPLSSFNLLTPPGVNHEDAFPWEIVVRPALLDDVVDLYPHLKGRIVEDTDIASVIGLSTSQQTSGGGTGGTGKGRLRGHVWLYTCYERPCRSYPDGRVVVLVSNSYTLADVADELPYRTPDGIAKSGIEYFHWWRLDDRFWSRSFIEPLKDPQRLINRRETQNAEIIDRGMPKVFVQEGALPHTPTGKPLEIVEMSDTSKEPHFFAGIGPGPWMYEDLAHHADNLSHASTLGILALGQNPTNVNTYAQLALLNENESAKRSSIMTEHKAAVGRLVEHGVWDIRKYWPEEKLILVSGDEGNISRKAFQKSKVPDFYVVKVARGSAKPRSQGAELTKVDAIWQAALNSGVVAAAPQKWVEWLDKSYAAGEALDLPGEEQGSQVEFAHFENFLLEQGEQPAVAAHDLAPVHAPVHFELLDQARASEDAELVGRITRHLHEHTQMVTDTRKAWRFFDPADTNDLASDVALDEDQALRENEMLVAGAPINPEEFQKALASLKQGVNPETGQPLQPQDDLEGILERAALKPSYVENFQMHLDRHGKVIKSQEFTAFPADVRRRFLTHFDLTREAWLSLPTMPDKVAAPKVSLQLRESVGPSTIAEVLRRGGVPEADPQTVGSEEPMANMVKEDAAPLPGAKPADAKPAAKPAQPKPKPTDQGAAK